MKPFPTTDGPAIKQTVQAYLDNLVKGNVAGAKQYLSSSSRAGTMSQMIIATLHFRDFGNDIYNPNAPDIASYDFVVYDDTITQESPGLAHVTAQYSGETPVTLYFTIVKEGRWLIDGMDTELPANLRQGGNSTPMSMPTDSPTMGM